MAVFPLPVLPDAPWRNLKKAKNTYFGAGRDNGYPTHGACDLIVPAGTKVLAVEHGTILRHYFFVNYKSFDKTTKAVTCDRNTWAMDVQHDTFIARYAEIAPSLPAGIAVGQEVQEGQTIAFVGAQCGGTMLHFEMFKDRDRVNDYLTDKSHSTKYPNVQQANYERRDDLLDPTPFLDAWSWDLRAKLHRTMDLSFETDD